mgnify:CR=1 FL=1
MIFGLYGFSGISFGIISTIFYGIFNIPTYIGAIIISVLAFITFFKDINGIVKINSYLIPILIFLIFYSFF